MEIEIFFMVKKVLGLPSMPLFVNVWSYKRVTAYLFASWLLISSCEQLNRSGSATSNPAQAIEVASSLSIQDIGRELQHLLPVSDTLSGLKDSFIADQILSTVYKEHQYQPFWIKEEGIPVYASNMLEQSADLKYDGLPVEQYHLQELKEQTSKLVQATSSEWAAWDLAMSKTFLQITHDLLLGYRFEQKSNKEWKNKNDSAVNWYAILQKSTLAGDFSEAFRTIRPDHPWYHKFREEYQRLDSLKTQFSGIQLAELKDSIVNGFSSQEIPVLRKRLYAEMQVPVDTQSTIWNTELGEALKRFQYRHQLKSNGKLDTATVRRLNQGVNEKLEKLALNMERFRWLKHDFVQPYIWVNIPKMDMEYIEKDSTQFAMRVVVGRPSRPTPSLDAKIENVVLSPPWVVPPTIMKEEIVPGIARRGGSYLARRGLKAYDRRGRVVSASAINSKNFRSFSIGQAPGYRSSLGEVKFNMPNPWSIYMHDTPHREDFVKFYRAFSSGCVRVHKPKEFAAFLLRDTVMYSLSKIDSICKLRRTIFVPMKRRVDVHFVYLTTGVDSAGNILFLKDLYNWDQKDMAARN